MLGVAAAALLAGAGAEAPLVVLLGDSITAGAVSGPAGSPGSGANGPGYASRVREALAGRARVASLGLGSTTTADWVASLRENGPSGGPGAVAVILLGTNDALERPEGEPIPRAAFRENLRVLAAGYLAEFETVVLLPPPPMPAVNPNANAAWQARLAGYHEEVLAACAELARVACGPDVFALLDPRADFFQGNLHPNAQGHHKLAEALAAALARDISGAGE